MTGLLWYEARKRWESLKWPALGVLGVVLVLTVITGFMDPTSEGDFGPRPGVAGVLLGVLNPLLAVVWLYPLLDAVWRFHTDLAGRHAPLEVGIARPGWQKVLAKLLVSVALFVLSTWAVGLVQAVKALATRGAGDIQWWVFLIEPLGLLQIVVLGLVLLACTAGYHVLKHRTRWAAPLMLVVFVGFVWLQGMVATGFGTKPPEESVGALWIVAALVSGVLAFLVAGRLYDRVEV